jgi:4'-phosphopantetheinyl transferase
LKALANLQLPGTTLEHLCFSAYNKPYFPGQTDFNISHSGDYVVCAVSQICRVGIDLENIHDINPEEFVRCFTNKEWAYIHGSSRPVQTFYELWTRKEAVIKADGRGLHIPLQSFEVIDYKTVVENTVWYMQPIPLEDGYIAHLATNKIIDGGYSIQHYNPTALLLNAPSNA